MENQSGTSERKYEFLEQLSIEDLELLLRLSSDSDESETFFDAVGEVIVRRESENPTGRLPDVDEAWREFQAYCNAPEKPVETSSFMFDAAEDKPVSRARPHKPARHSPHKHRPIPSHILGSAALVAVSLTLAFACMVGAQAAGTNIFGALARWTDETFRFLPSPSSEEDSFRIALRQQGIPEELAPSWLPDGFILEELISFRNDDGESVTANYLREGDSLVIGIHHYYNSQTVEQLGQQIDGEFVERFFSFGREFYILSNLDILTATWSDGTALVLSIGGNVSEEEIKEIINSIGGRVP